MCVGIKRVITNLDAKQCLASMCLYYECYRWRRTHDARPDEERSETHVQMLRTSSSWAAPPVAAAAPPDAAAAPPAREARLFNRCGSCATSTNRCRICATTAAQAPAAGAPESAELGKGTKEEDPGKGKGTKEEDTGKN